jgi:hypothetical protein
MVKTMRSHQSSLRAIAEAMFAGESGPPPHDRLDWLCADFEDFLEQAGPRPKLILGGAVFLATWVAPLSIGRRPPLGRLDIADRCRALHKTEATKAGLPILAVKAMLSIMYYEHPDAQADIGVDTICMGAQS